MPNEDTSTETKPPEGDTTDENTTSAAPATSENGSTSTASTNGGSAEGSGTPSSLSDVLAGLDEAAQNIVKAEINRKNNEAKNLRDRVKAMEPKAKAHDEAQEAQRSAEDKLADRERLANEKADKATARMVRAEVRALAAGKFADAEDAAAFLDAGQYLDSSGEPDTDAISAALDDLLSRKPHLAKADPKPRPPAPNPAQGATAPAKTGGDLGLAEAQRRFGQKQATTTS